MVTYTATIDKFGDKGEKTGWTYIEVPVEIALQLKPGNKKSFRVKGKLDAFAIAAVALIPMGEGKFILPLNGAMRKGTRKKKGDKLKVQLTIDNQELMPSPAFLECLADEPAAEVFFNSLPRGHRNYFIKWMAGVKTEEAVSKRMAQAINALARKMDFVNMVHFLKAQKQP